MKLIRENIFESNSSSTHSITMCKESEFKLWKEGKLYYCDADGKFYSEEEAKLKLKKSYIYDEADYESGDEYKDSTFTYKGVTVNRDNLEKLYTEENLNEITDEMLDEHDFDYYELPLSYDEWDEYYDELEKYHEEYTTENGDKVIAFGYYGYN